MKPLQFKLVLIVFVLALLTSCSNEEDGIYFNEINEVKNNYSLLELDILDLVNEHRESQGMESLNTLNIISSVAYSHTTYMTEIDKPSHDNFSQRQENLVENAAAKSVGENVAYGFTTANGVVSAWMRSESHRAIIENKHYTHFGISIEKNKEGRNYFTQIFIKR